MTDDLISRQAAIEKAFITWQEDSFFRPEMVEVVKVEDIKNLPSAQRWIPVTAELPKEFTPVNVTWVNHSPISYYADIKDKPFTATAIYYDGEWWWYSSRCEDYLKEYGVSDMDYVADGIEITAWMPLPEPWKGDADE